MSGIRHSLGNEINRLDNCKLLYVTSSVYSANLRVFEHTHYFSELFYVISGGGQFLVNGKRHLVKASDLVVVNPHISHTEVLSPDIPTKGVLLGVDDLTFSFKDNHSGYGIFHNNKNHKSTSLEFGNILNEMELKGPYYEQMCKHQLGTLLISLMRDVQFGFSFAPPKDIPSECLVTKKYMDSHFHENITLDFLADLSHLNKYYLAHSFQKAYGISPINYLNERRIQYSKDTLINTSFSVAEISQISGFSSQSYFSQVFKKQTGMTPVDYRKLMSKK